MLILLTRHAEKAADGTSDPALSPAGRMMAGTLDKLLADVPIKAVYSTPYKRTQETVESVATRHAVPVQEYEPLEISGLPAKIRAAPGDAVVVAGHGNTVPMLLNSLCPEARLPVMNEGDYGRLFVISYFKDQPERNHYFILNLGLDYLR